MFKKRAQPTEQRPADAPAAEDGTFLDGVFGERRPRLPHSRAGQPQPVPDPAPVASSGAARQGGTSTPAPDSAAPQPTAQRPTAKRPAVARPAAPRPTDTRRPAGVTPARATPTRGGPTSPAPTLVATPTAAPPTPAPPASERPGPLALRRFARRHGRLGLVALVAVVVVELALLVALLIGGIASLRGGGEQSAPTGQRPTTTSQPPVDTAAPGALPKQGSLSQTTVAPDGEVTVRQWIRSRSRIERLRLRFPRQTPLPSAAAARDLIVTVDGSEVPAPTTVKWGGGKQIELARAGSLVYLSYRLDGVLDADSSVEHRALVRLAALSVDKAAAAGPAVVTVRAHRVLALACLDRPSSGQVGTPYPCGGPTSTGWKVRLDKVHRGASVSAQVELR